MLVLRSVRLCVVTLFDCRNVDEAHGRRAIGNAWR
jgi:hypothetical protein